MLQKVRDIWNQHAGQLVTRGQLAATCAVLWFLLK
jgi:hypothetical protein